MHALEKSVFIDDNGEFILGIEHLTILAPQEALAKQIICDLVKRGHLQAFSLSAMISEQELSEMLMRKETPHLLRISNFKRARFSILLIRKKLGIGDGIDTLNDLLQIRDEIIVSECFAYIHYTFKQKKVPYQEIHIQELRPLIYKGVSNFSLSQLYSYIWYISILVMEQPKNEINTKSRFKKKYIELFQANSYRIKSSQNHLEHYTRPKSLQRSSMTITIDDELFGLFEKGFNTKSFEAIESIMGK